MVDQFVTIDSVTGHLPDPVEERITDIAGTAGGGGGGPASAGEPTWRVPTAGATQTLPTPADYGVAIYTLSADLTLSVFPGGDLDEDLTYTQLVWIRQPSTGGSYYHTVDWPDDIDWADGGVPPVVATGQGAQTFVTLTTDDAGATVAGSASVPNQGNQAVSLTIDGDGHVAVDASAGDLFILDLTEDAIIDAPTNLTAWKMLLFCVMQDEGGGHTLDWDNIYGWSNTSPEVFLSTADGKSDYIGGIYNPMKTKVHMLASDVGH